MFGDVWHKGEVRQMRIMVGIYDCNGLPTSDSFALFSFKKKHLHILMTSPAIYISFFFLKSMNNLRE